MNLLQAAIEKARRAQQQKPGQLEIDDLTISDIEMEEMWEEHRRERIAQMELERRGRKPMPNETNAELMAIYYEQSNFMLTLRAAAEETWATAEEALDEWRSRTLEDFGFQRYWIEALDR